jgi:hypothetical protein
MQGIVKDIFDLNRCWMRGNDNNRWLWSNLNGHFAKTNKYDSEVSHERKTKQITLHKRI